MADFSDLADKFNEQVWAVNIQPATEVNLIFHAVDTDGHPLPPNKLCISTPLTVKGMGSGEAAQKLAASLHLGDIIGSINSVVRGCPTGPTIMQGFGNQVVTITNIELEIIQP